MQATYSLSDFDFELPPELIAQLPLPQRSASRLLHVDGETLIDRQFADIVGQLSAGDLLVFNDTRVLKARFFGVKATGGKVEVLVERVIDHAHRACAGARVQVAAGRQHDTAGRRVRCDGRRAGRRVLHAWSFRPTCSS